MPSTTATKIPRKTTRKAIKAVDKFVAQKEEEMTPERRRYAGLMTAHVLMGAYNRDTERGGGMLLHALKHLDTDTYNLFYKQVQKAVTDKIKELEAPYANQTTRKPRASSAHKGESKDTRGHRAAGSGTRKAPARKSAGTRTTKKCG